MSAIQVKVAMHKRENPELYCRDSRCLFRTVTRSQGCTTYVACPKHPRTQEQVVSDIFTAGL